MKRENHEGHTFVAFLLGMAAGAAITFLLTSEDRQEIFEKVTQNASKLRNDLDHLVEKGKNIVSEVSEYFQDKSESNS